MPLMLVKYSRVVFWGFGVVRFSPMKMLSVLFEVSGRWIIGVLVCTVFGWLGG